MVALRDLSCRSDDNHFWMFGDAAGKPLVHVPGHLRKKKKN
jgi:hypothetical protein